MIHQAKKSDASTLKNQLPDAIKNMGGEMIKECKQIVSESVELSKEMLACRTSKEMMEFQQKASQQLLDNYFSRSNKLSGMMFDTCSNVINAFNKRAAMVSDEIHKAAA